jgi:hypothetical protein
MEQSFRQDTPLRQGGSPWLDAKNLDADVISTRLKMSLQLWKDVLNGTPSHKRIHESIASPGSKIVLSEAESSELGQMSREPKIRLKMSTGNAPGFLWVSFKDNRVLDSQ